jgi:hypothetical protein
MGQYGGTPIFDRLFTNFSEKLLIFILIFIKVGKMKSFFEKLVKMGQYGGTPIFD